MAGLLSIICFVLISGGVDSVASSAHDEHSSWTGIDVHDSISTKPSLILGPQNARQRKIVDMMKHAWKGYEKHCFGSDELRPLDGSCVNTWRLGVTLIDSLDTLYLMGLQNEFKKA